MISFLPQYNKPIYKIVPVLFGLLHKVTKEELETNGYVDYTNVTIMSFHFTFEGAMKARKRYLQGINYQG